VLVGNVRSASRCCGRPAPHAGMYGPLPVEVAVFADAGVAWNSDERPSVLGGFRDGVSSTGINFRVNLPEFAGQFDFVRPPQRPGKGWISRFNLTPGF